MPKIKFFLRPSSKKSTSRSLFCRVTFRKTKAEFSLGEKLDPDKWSQSSQTYSGGSRKYQDFIRTLTDTVSVEIKQLAAVNCFHSAQEILQALKPKEEVHLEDLVEKYIQSESRFRRSGTIRNHQIKLKNLRSFQKQQNLKFTSSSFNRRVALRFKAWYLKKNNTTNVDSANRNILFYKSALEFGFKNGLFEDYPLSSYRGEKDPIKLPIYLNELELEKFEMAGFSTIPYLQVKDLFLFQCYTGVSYVDLWGSWEVKDHQGSEILLGNREKNGNTFVVPLSEKAKQLLVKYHYSLPRICNAYYNRMLKEIASQIGINKRVTTHTARKTFATIMNSLGWSRESVSMMLGHRSTRTTEVHYLGDSHSRILNEISNRKAS